MPLRGSLSAELHSWVVSHRHERAIIKILLRPGEIQYLGANHDRRSKDSAEIDERGAVDDAGSRPFICFILIVGTPSDIDPWTEGASSGPTGL